MTKIRLIERLAWILGLALIAVWGTVRVHGALMQEQELERFHEARRAVQAAAVSETPLSAELPTDSSLWSVQRIEAHEASLNQPAGTPLAILRIPSIRLEVAVLQGVDEWTLNRAVGTIPGMALPGETGNVGIAGHRDGFFRRLKDVRQGDVIELVTLEGTEEYAIAETRIIDPDAVEVLAPTPEPAITLVTCYPFYYVGSAPQRYVVRAVRSKPATD